MEYTLVLLFGRNQGPTSVIVTADCSLRVPFVVVSERGLDLDNRRFHLDFHVVVGADAVVGDAVTLFAKNNSTFVGQPLKRGMVKFPAEMNRT